MKKYILGIWMVCLASLGMAQTPKAEQVMNKKQQYIVEVAALVGKGDLAKLKPVHRRITVSTTNFTDWILLVFNRITQITYSLTDITDSSGERLLVYKNLLSLP